MGSEQSFTTRSEEETVHVGQRLAAMLHPGSTVLLHGDLGAGKTTLVRGIAEGLGADPDLVSSPTFVLIQEYRGRVTLYHVDLYRIEGAAVDELGLEELADSGGVMVIEWADRMTHPPAGAIRVKLEEKGENSREIVISP